MLNKGGCFEYRPFIICLKKMKANYLIDKLFNLKYEIEQYIESSHLLTFTLWRVYVLGFVHLKKHLTMATLLEILVIDRKQKGNPMQCNVIGAESCIINGTKCREEINLLASDKF